MEKPVIYECKLPASTVPQRKFDLVVAYIKETLEKGMRK